MAKTSYHAELKRIMTDNSPAAPTARSRAEIKADIAIITARLMGPLNNVERLWLVEDRRELRKQLEVVS